MRMCSGNVLRLSKGLNTTSYKQWPQELFSLGNRRLVGGHRATVMTGSLRVSQGIGLSSGSSKEADC